MAITKAMAEKALKGSISFGGEKVDLLKGDTFTILDFESVKDYFAIKINDSGDFIFSSHQINKLIEVYGNDVKGTKMRYTEDRIFKGNDGKNRRIHEYEIVE